MTINPSDSLNPPPAKDISLGLSDQRDAKLDWHAASQPEQPFVRVAEMVTAGSTPIGKIGPAAGMGPAGAAVSSIPWAGPDATWGELKRIGNFLSTTLDTARGLSAASNPGMHRGGFSTLSPEKNSNVVYARPIRDIEQDIKLVEVALETAREGGAQNAVKVLEKRLEKLQEELRKAQLN